MEIAKKLRKLRDQKGVTLVLVAALTVLFVAIIALSVDIAHLYAVKNELQNAADAGALAGARRLYFPDGTQINSDANQVACDAAMANNSERVAVEVNSPATNADDVQRGHWSFATHTFTRWDNTDPTELWDVTSAYLDTYPAFVNAVMVRTHRASTQADSFFARILGYAGFNVSAQAVAYIGFAGTLEPFAMDEPIAICRQTLLMTGTWNCSIARMFNSSGMGLSTETAAWTNFTQPCETATGSGNCPRGIECHFGGNDNSVTFGIGIGTTNGVSPSMRRLMDQEWLPNSNNGTTAWNIDIPVIDCPSSPLGNCMMLVGAVNVDVIWIFDQGSIGNNEVPTEMHANGIDWSMPLSIPMHARWNSFRQTFNLRNPDGTYAEMQQKSIYFLPNCSPHAPKGNTAGENFGILAKIPVLVN
jgi:Flp pilus assembly protein TadG